MKSTTTPWFRLSSLFFVLGLLLFATQVGCTDEIGGDGRCQVNETYNPVSGVCTPNGSGDGAGDGVGDSTSDGDGSPGCGSVDCASHEECYNGTCYPSCDEDLDCGAENLSCASGACVDLCDYMSCSAPEECFRGQCRLPCQNLQCDQVTCPAGSPTTTISGRVTIPRGDLPLADVNVYVPNAPLAPIEDGASCIRCDDQFSGEPLVSTTTDIDGRFRLENAPVGSDIPVVIQIGKWRRQITLPNVEACTDNPIVDETLTRLPRNSQEGDIPKIAITTGGWDALECLALKIGIDEQEFTVRGGGGRVNLFAGRGGTNRFANRLHGGAQFPNAWSWWNSLNNLLEYDIILHSCEGAANASDKPVQARQALQNFTEIGGRVFMSHWHNYWLDAGPAAGFGSVATWSGTNLTGQATGFIDSSFAKGQLLRDWLVHTGSPTLGQINILDTRGTVSSINNNIVQRWIWLNQGSNQRTQYFSFNSPVGVEEAQQCGRVVFSDIHVAGADRSSANDPFPNGCVSTGWSDQEKALVFMFFDLANCIIPDCNRLTCGDIDADCGSHADGCGGSITCGPPCCIEIEGSCNSDEDCCDSLWCDDNNGTCTDRCRAPAERCNSSADCCSGVCSAVGGIAEPICVVQ